MDMVYVIHPYTGNEKANVSDARELIRRLHKRYPDVWFTSTLGEFYEDTDYETVMKHCLNRIAKCNYVYLSDGWKESSGCRREVKFAKEIGIPIWPEKQKAILVFTAVNSEISHLKKSSADFARFAREYVNEGESEELEGWTNDVGETLHRFRFEMDLSGALLVYNILRDNLIDAKLHICKA